jgi:REP element-mobilizing transposase RayT
MGALITPRQEKVLQAIQEHAARQGYPPTLAELGKVLGIRSPNGVRAHLLALERKGYLQRSAGASRGIVVAGLPGALEDAPERGRRGGGQVLGSVTFHLAWATRGARPLLAEAGLAAAVEECVEHVAAEHGWRILGLRVGPSLVELSVAVDPRHSAASVVAHVRWRSALLRIGDLRPLGLRRLWARGFAAAGSQEELQELVARLLAEARRNTGEKAPETGGA